MKKWISTIILVMLVFSLSACGQQDNKSNEGKKKQKQMKCLKLELFQIKMPQI